MTDVTPHVEMAEFFETFEPPADLDTYASFIKEEVEEAKEAMLHLAKELADIQYTVAGYTYILLHHVPMADRPTEIPEAIEEANGVFEALGGLLNSVCDFSLYRAIHESNMTKLGEDGKPIRHPETGKILKGPNYREPDLTDLVFRPMNHQPDNQE